MALETIQQIHQLLTQKSNILITFQKNGKGDAIGSAVALKLFLEKLGKRVDIVVDEFELPSSFKFLKKTSEIKSKFSHLQKFMIMVDIKETGMDQITYDVKDEKLYICVTPKNGIIDKQNINTAQTDFTYDLIITLDTQDLGSIGNIYSNNTNLFYSIPILNIDHNSANEHYGQINFTDITASSTAEILYKMMTKLGDEYIDKEISTALLTGMIAHTRSFKTSNVRPQSLVVASKLMSSGADRETIIRHLYHTRSLPSLKLWGQALAHLQHDKSIGLVWTTITRDNFVRSGANEHDLEEIIEELIGNSPEAKIILLLHEHPEIKEEHVIHGIVKTQLPFDAKLLTSPFSPKGNHGYVSIVSTEKSLSEFEQAVIDNIRKVVKVIQD